MNSIIFISLLLNIFSLIGSITSSCCECCKKDRRIGFLEYNTFDHCDGKDSYNYTLIDQFSRDSQCDLNSWKPSDQSQLLSCSPSSKQTDVNKLLILASSQFPDGAYTILEFLYLVISGPLEGKYVYLRKVILDPKYLKVCSSILGYNYVNSKQAILLISDKLDLNVLISTAGAFELFKKGCTTICEGKAIIVGPTQVNVNY